MYERNKYLLAYTYPRGSIKHFGTCQHNFWGGGDTMCHLAVIPFIISVCSIPGWPECCVETVGMVLDYPLTRPLFPWLSTYSLCLQVSPGSSENIHSRGLSKTQETRAQVKRQLWTGRSCVPSPDLAETYLILQKECFIPLGGRERGFANGNGHQRVLLCIQVLFPCLLPHHAPQVVSPLPALETLGSSMYPLK